MNTTFTIEIEKKTQVSQDLKKKKKDKTKKKNVELST